jgi:hypothetical protein
MHRVIGAVSAGRQALDPTIELRRAVHRVAFSSLLAIRSETSVKSDCALWHMPTEGEGEKRLRRYALMYELGYVLEPEPPVVLRMPHNAASCGTEVLQSG